jgi:hypothetical protein
MNREAVADRIVTYCDALMAFSLVNGFAFFVALAEPDIRCSIANIAVFMAGVTVISPLAASVALVWLRRYELRLREDVSDEALVSRFWRIVGISRFVLIWVFALIVVIGIWAATQDPSCSLARG